MGIYTRYSAAFLILALLTPKAFSAVRVPVIQNDEYIRQVLSRQTAATGAITTPAGDVAFYGADKVFAFNPGDSVRPTVREVKSTISTPSFPYGPGAAYPNDPSLTPAAATKVKVKPQVVVPKANILKGLKDGLKTTPAQLAATATVAAALGAVGWVMSPDNTQLQKKTSEGDLASTNLFRWVPAQGSWCGGQNFQSISAAHSCIRDAYRAHNIFADTVTVDTAIMVTSTSYQLRVKATNSNGSVNYASNVVNLSGDCSAPAVRVEDRCVTGQPTYAPLSSTDFNSIDPWVSRQSAAWLGGLLRDVCNGSLNPGACYSQMADRSKGMIQGPALVPGPVTTKTTQIPNPDGTTSTRTETTKTDFKLTYGKEHFDVDTEKKTTVTQDGQLVSETTEKDDTPPQDVADTTPGEEQTEEPEYTFIDSEFPEVTPFYEQKYPDGLAGVWNQAKADIDNSNFMRFLSSFIPSFSGSCPAFGMQFAIGNMANFGSQDFNSLCYVFDFIKIIFLVTAVFTARALTFGG